MNFTFNFFFPVMTAFTTLWAAAFFDRGNLSSPANAIVATVPQPDGRRRPRRTRTRVSHSRSTTGQPVLRRSARLRQNYTVPPKIILPPASQRRPTLHREGAIATISNTTTTTTTTTTTQQLKREDSFVLVDYGNHFRMIKPAYAMRYFHKLPDNFRTVAPYHALGPTIGEQELRKRLLAVPIAKQHLATGTKRVRSVEEEEPGGVDEAHPRKRRRMH